MEIKETITATIRKTSIKVEKMINTMRIMDIMMAITTMDTMTIIAIIISTNIYF